MSRRQLGLVGAALVLLVVAAVLAAVLSSGASERELRGVSELTSDSVDHVLLKDGTSEATLLKEDGTWMVGTYPVVAWLLESLWNVTGQIDGADLIATNPDNHHLMGVTPATGSLIQFWSGGELIEEFIVGDREFARAAPGAEIIAPWTQAASTCFLRRPDENEVYGVFCEEPNRFIPVPTWWADPIIVRVIPQDIQSVTVEYPDSRYLLNKISGIEWRLDDGEQEANLTKTVDVIERFRVFAAEAYPDETEAAGVDFTQTDARVSLVVEEQDTGVRRDITILFVRRDDEYYHVKDAATDWSYLISTTSTAAILQPRDWFLTSLKPRPAPTSTAP